MAFSYSFRWPISCMMEPTGIISQDLTLLSFLIGLVCTFFFFQFIQINDNQCLQSFYILFVKSSMNLSEIRNKYRQIIDDSDDSQEELPNNIDKVQLVKTRILTENNQNIANSNIKDPSSKIIISLKERIAQGIKNISIKENQNNSLRNQISKLQCKIQLLQQELTMVRKTFEKEENKLVEEKVKCNSLQAQIEKLNQNIKFHEMDKELIYKKIQFYKKQISQQKSQKQNLLKEMQSYTREMKEVEKTKCFNKRLKEDLKRMHVILNQFTEKKSSKKIEDKHFLGKPYKQYQNWYPQSLVGEVQSFLKRQQVGHGNKDFTSNLVKFIDKYTKQLGKQNKQKRANQLCKTKEDKSRLYLSTSLCQKNASTNKSQVLERSTLKQSILYSRFTKNGSKKCTQSLLYNQPSFIEIKCEQILTQYYNMMVEVVNQKDLKKKKIIRLAQQIKKNILSLFDSEHQLRN